MKIKIAPPREKFISPTGEVKILSYSEKISASFCSMASIRLPRRRMVPSGAKRMNKWLKTMRLPLPESKESLSIINLLVSSLVMVYGLVSS
jgi:hypothetical protein